MKGITKKDRAKFIFFCDVLEQVKPVVMLPGINMMTLEMAAKYFSTTEGEIRCMYHRKWYYEEFENDGVMEVSKSELSNMLYNAEPENVNRQYFYLGDTRAEIRAAVLSPKTSILRLSMVLPENEIAEKIRDLLVSEYAEQAGVTVPLNKTTKGKHNALNVGDELNGFKVVSDLGYSPTHHRYMMFECCHCKGQFKSEKFYINSGQLKCPYCSERNHTREIFGNYKVLQLCDERTSSRGNVWLCECTSCGELRKISAATLVNKTPPKCDCQKTCVDYTSPVKKQSTPKASDLDDYLAQFASYNRLIGKLRAENQEIAKRVAEETKKFNNFNF